MKKTFAVPLSLQSLSLYHFKNYGTRDFVFQERVVGICGKNGAGKTNLLDAIHYLCFTKSYFSSSHAQHALHGHTGFRIEGHFVRNETEQKAVCVVRETGRKEFWLNDIAYTRFSQHIGYYPCVVIAPDDAQLITGSGDERRRFLDTLLSQLDAEYLIALIQYQKILQQRNSFLRNYGEGYAQRDLSVLDILDVQLVKEGQTISSKRSAFLLQFLPVVKAFYNEIGNNYENVTIIYDSELLVHDYKKLVMQNRQKDLALQRTSAGPHRDDLNLLMGDHNFKNTASQGQRKSLLFALKLAEMQILKQEKELDPLLLLDDVFEKLDETRIQNLLRKVCQENAGQVFITDTNAERLTAVLQHLEIPHQIISL